MHVLVPWCLHNSLWLIVHKLLNIKRIFDPNLSSEKLGSYLAIMHKVKHLLCVSNFLKIEDLCLGSNVVHLFSKNP